MKQNFPNPFNPTTCITFALREPAHVALRIYDVSGRLVRVLVDEEREARVYEEVWDGVDGSGRAAASGIYFYRIEAGAFVDTKKMVLLR
ncbi:MAG: T9SS type A sorting domain-containing protein [bacterium]|nr:MAG: T9SS type A sorting domain-containing protein [bacterium]